MTVIIIKEDTKYQKKYKCPYCDRRDIRQELIDHIDKEHKDMIPKDHTATRVVFNMINKKEHGSCVMCRKDSEWDEDKARYNRLCENKACKIAYTKLARTNTGIDEKLRDPEFQQKMLAGRSISGNYKFNDGGLVSYTGSYEKQLLEFLDTFLKVKSYDIQSPGPVIEYEYQGSKHMWITDQYMIPYNLVFDVKDGGDNPNRREMGDYRAKQLAKEEAIRKQGKYNYIRLTNNSFDQLLDIMLELKYSFDQKEKKKPIIHINENSSIAINSMPPANINNVYIIDYMKRNTFIKSDEHHYAICKDYMQDAITVKNGIFDTLSIDALKEMDFINVYKCNDDIEYTDLIESSQEDTDFYKYITDQELLDSNQFRYHPVFEQVVPFTESLKAIEEGILATALPTSGVINEAVLPYFEVEQYSNINSSWKQYRDIAGEFIMNEDTGFRSKSYKDNNELEDKKEIIMSIMNIL